MANPNKASSLGRLSLEEGIILDIRSIFASLFGKTTASLTRFLERILPSISDNWWNEVVLNVLSLQQQRRVEQRNINSLLGLDLAALLRVLDRNWYHVSNRLNISPDQRHYVKEMQTIRNFWMHLDSQDPSTEDIYRHFDTLQRFLILVGAEDELIQEIKSLKSSLLREEDSNHSVQLDAEVDPDPDNPSNFEFQPGQIVFLESNPEIRGAVISVLPGNPENRYNVFIHDETRTYYASQLNEETANDNEIIRSTFEQFHSYLTALQIKHPGLSTLYSLHAARIDFIPYQFRPVLKFIRSDRPRLLIADGVGVGKTIEAGLILRELQARRDIRSVLIVCPRPLVVERKWEKEMKRFDENFIHLDGKELRFCVDEMDLEGEWPRQYQKIIVPYSLFDEILLYGRPPGRRQGRRLGLLDLDPYPRFDLVIVDEAHHIRNPDTYSYRAVRFFCDNAEAVVFLTATPIQMGSDDLFTLLNILRPDLIIDKESFEHMAEPNPFINQAVSHVRAQEQGWALNALEALEEAMATGWGQAILRDSPEFELVRNQLSQNSLVPEERIQIINDLEGLHTFSGIINRTRRRDIGEFTTRRPETILIEFTPEQEQFHNDLLMVQSEILGRIHTEININFLMTTIRRQAASCLFGLAPLLQDILNRHIDELMWNEADNMQDPPNENAFEPLEESIHRILRQAENLSPIDPKLEALKGILHNKQQLENNKIMLFSSFHHTLHYLLEHLKNDGFRVGLVYGKTPDEERCELRNRFELDRENNEALDVLLFSEIGCEGLDYQFCDSIINYDIPWNPMRIEQRIGRIDRLGQKSESIAIFNLITPGTIDADIYQRCFLRIGIFEREIGGSEEILGQINREVRNIAENLSLNEEERNNKLQQMADNKIRLVNEQLELEERQLEFFGIRLPSLQFEKDIDEASSFWLKPGAIYILVSSYIKEKCGEEHEFILGEKQLKTLRLSHDARNELLVDFQLLPRNNTSYFRDWENWLKGGEPRLSITFEADCASENPKAAFITPVHPFAKQAAQAFDFRKPIVTALKAKHETIPVGKYPFAIYQWQFHGIREDLTLCPVTASDAVRPHLAKLIEIAAGDQAEQGYISNSSLWQELDTHHYQAWSEACQEHRRNTRRIAQYKNESLATSHRARISLLQEQLGQAANENIQRMRRSQIAAAETDFARRTQELEIAMERADISAQPVAYGEIRIERN